MLCAWPRPRFKQAQSNYETVKMEVELAVKEAFYRLLWPRRRLAAATDDGQRGPAYRRRPAELNPWDRIEAEGIGEKPGSGPRRPCGNFTLRRLDFLKALNLELDTAFRVMGQLEPQSVEVDPRKAALWAMELRPELQSETFKAEMDAIAVNLAVSRRYPTLFVAGDYDLTDQHFPCSTTTGTSASASSSRSPMIFSPSCARSGPSSARASSSAPRSRTKSASRSGRPASSWPIGSWRRACAASSTAPSPSIYEKAAPGAAASLGKLRALMTVIEMRLSYLEAVTESTLARARLERAVGRELTP